MPDDLIARIQGLERVVRELSRVKRGKTSAAAGNMPAFYAGDPGALVSTAHSRWVTAASMQLTMPGGTVVVSCETLADVGAHGQLRILLAGRPVWTANIPAGYSTALTSPPLEHPIPERSLEDEPADLSVQIRVVEGDGEVAAAIAGIHGGSEATPRLTSITADPASAEITKGGSALIGITARYDDGSHGPPARGSELAADSADARIVLASPQAESTISTYGRESSPRPVPVTITLTGANGEIATTEVTVTVTSGEDDEEHDGDDEDWDPDEHPRDEHGRFIDMD